MVQIEGRPPPGRPENTLCNLCDLDSEVAVVARDHLVLAGGGPRQVVPRSGLGVHCSAVTLCSLALHMSSGRTTLGSMRSMIS